MTKGKYYLDLINGATCTPDEGSIAVMLSDETKRDLGIALRLGKSMFVSYPGLDRFYSAPAVKKGNTLSMSLFSDSAELVYNVVEIDVTTGIGRITST